MMISLIKGPLGKIALENGWAEKHQLTRMEHDIRKWGKHPDAFFANIHVEVWDGSERDSFEFDGFLGNVQDQYNGKQAVFFHKNLIPVFSL